MPITPAVDASITFSAACAEDFDALVVLRIDAMCESLQRVFAKADAQRVALRVGALRESASNRFYERHGFQLVERAEFDNYYVRAAHGAA